MPDETATRERILDAARSVLRERGTSGARMQDIADEARVNKALLHYYFRNKETLSAAVFQRELQRLIQPVLGVLGSDLLLEDKVRQVVDLYLQALTAMPGLPGYVLAELNFHPERIGGLMTTLVGADPQGAVNPVLRKLGEQIDGEVAAGRMRPMPPAQFAVNLIGLCVFPFAARPLIEGMLLEDRDFDRFLRERKAQLPEFFLRGVRP